LFKERKPISLHKKIFLLLVVIAYSAFGNAQDSLTTHASSGEPMENSLTHTSSGEWLQDSLSANVSPGKLIAVAGIHGGIWAGTYLALNKAWYADYPRSAFHFFNDNREWNQIDKAGHLWTTYQVSRLSAEMWKWTGLPAHTGVLLGGVSGLAYQSIIEIQDGFSSEWGFSWGDMAANFAGATAFCAQELGWKTQRIQIKMSYWPYDYPAPLLSRRNELFGSSLAERILKDYNSQTYWLSGNLKEFFPESRIPSWLNFSVGYASGGMLGGMENTWKDKDGIVQDYRYIRRTRHIFLAPDIDLTRIPTRSRLLKSLFFALNAVKFPAPALELSRGKLKLHAVCF
jgi:hypothetical protein